MRDAYQDIVVARAKKQKVLIDTFFGKAPILATMPTAPTSDGDNNVYESLSNVSSLEITNMDGAYTEATVGSELEQTRLSSIKGKIVGLKDKVARMGGWDAYVSKQLLPILNVTGQKMETSILYNSILRACIKHGRVKNMAGGVFANNKKYATILIVNWAQGQNTGLYNPELKVKSKSSGMREFGMFDFQNIPLSVVSGSGATSKYGYTMLIDGNMGVQLANVTQYCYAITGINLEDSSSYPTAAQLAGFMAECDSDGNTGIYMHRQTKVAVTDRFKEGALKTIVSDNEYKRSYDLFEGSTILTTNNMGWKSNAEKALYAEIKYTGA